MSKRSAVPIVSLVCGLSLLAYCGERLGCLKQRAKPAPRRLECLALIEKIAALKKQQSGFFRDRLSFEADEYRITVGRSREDSPARHVSVTLFRDETLIRAEDFSPTGTVAELCVAHSPQWDNQPIAEQDIIRTYEVKDGPLVGDILTLRWSKETPLEHPWAIELYNMEYLHSPLTWLFDAGPACSCLSSLGRLAKPQPKTVAPSSVPPKAKKRTQSNSN